MINSVQTPATETVDTNTQTNKAADQFAAMLENLGGFSLKPCCRQD